MKNGRVHIMDNKQLRKYLVLLVVCCLGMGIVIIGYVSRDSTYDSIDRLFEAEIYPEETEIQALEYEEHSYYYAMYNPVEGSICFLRIKENHKRFQIAERSDKIGYPEGYAILPEIKGKIAFEDEELQFYLCQNQNLYSDSAYSNYKVVLFSDAMLLYSIVPQ